MSTYVWGVLCGHPCTYVVCACAGDNSMLVQKCVLLQSKEQKAKVDVQSNVHQNHHRLF